MCITAAELNTKVSEVRSLRALKEETENAIKALEHDIIRFMDENEFQEYIGNDFKATYKPQSRTTLDKERLTETLGDLSGYEKVTFFNVLRIK